MPTARSKGGRPAKEHLHQNKRTGEWRVRWVVRPPLIPILGKATLIRPLRTTDYQEARRRCYAPNAECQAILEDAERQLRGEPDPIYSWPRLPGQAFSAQLRKHPPPPAIVAAGERYQAFMQREHKIAISRLRGEPEKSADFETIIQDWVREKGPRESTIRPY